MPSSWSSRTRAPERSRPAPSTWSGRSSSASTCGAAGGAVPRDRLSPARHDGGVSFPQPPLFGSVDEVAERLAGVGYLASTAVATTVFLSDRLGKPLLVEGPAGVGKTELAKAVAEVAGARLIRLQCYEGVDESRALNEWNHAKQLLRISAGRDE